MRKINPEQAFFIADTHFGDFEIMKYENRPFKSVYEMNATLIKNWNSVVSDDDTVFVVGDFMAVDRIDNPEQVLKELKGNIYLIVGNHDETYLDFYTKNNIIVVDYDIILNDFWRVTHFPVYVNENSPIANIFGHVHNNPIYKTVSSRSYCVSVERINYTPIRFDKIIKGVYEEALKT